VPLQKLQFRPGLNREGTDYSNEGGWYDGDKIRFRSGFPEKIGGWTRLSANQYVGVCRDIWVWLDADLGAGNTYIGVGTNVKYYIYYGGTYNDITPITFTTAPTSPFSTAFSQLSGNLSISATSIPVNSGTSFPTIGGVVLIGSEQIAYNGVSGNTLTGATRGYNGTTPAIHSIGASVECYTVVLSDPDYSPNLGDYFIISGSTSVGGISLNGEFKVRGIISGTDFTFDANTPATSIATGGGTPTIEYLYPVGSAVFTTGLGWGAGPWNAGSASDPWAHGWGTPYTAGAGFGYQLRLWSSDNFGANLVLAPRGGPIFYWQDSLGVSTRAEYLSDLANATTSLTDSCTFTSGVSTITVTAPVSQFLFPYMRISGTGIPANTMVSPSYVTGTTSMDIVDIDTLVAATTTSGSSGTYSFSYAGDFAPVATYQVVSSAIQQFVIAFGSNAYEPGNPSTDFNPMLVRWSDQSNPYQWVPQSVNQSGEYLLTNGSYIMAGQATRQEILVWTDSCLYSMQYIGAPYIWGFQILMDNISVMSPNSMITVNNVTFWMGRDRFYMYSGRVEVLPCALRQYIFEDINLEQSYQVVCGTNNAFNEVWWFYVSISGGGTVVDRYVVYNYLDRNWYYGQMNRSAWYQTGTQPFPLAADYNGRLLYHENGNDDNSTEATLPITAYVQSSDFDIGDGHNFGFVWRILPDVNFNGSSVNNPSVTMTVKPRRNSGTPYGAADNPTVQSAQNYTRIPQYTVQEFDGQVYTRLRGRQMSFRIESTGLGVAWQLGSPRIDIRPDGRR
jgi:hypothetical protein